MASSRPRTAENITTIMLFGKTGSGKSSVGNCFSKYQGSKDTPFVVYDGLASNPNYKAMEKTFFLPDCWLRVIDTPGVMDTNRGQGGGEAKAISGICDAFSHCPFGVDVFVIVLRVDIRYTPEEHNAIEKLEVLLGKEFWRHAILLFTHGDHVNNQDMTFNSKINQAKNDLPILKKLIDSVSTKPLLIDSRKSGTNRETLKTQVQRLVKAIQDLKKANKSFKFRNYLFDTAKTQAVKKLTNERYDAEEEWKLVRELTENLKTGENKCEDKQKAMKKGLEDIEARLNGAKCEAATQTEQLIKENKEMYCCIL